MSTRSVTVRVAAVTAPLLLGAALLPGPAAAAAATPALSAPTNPCSVAAGVRFARLLTGAAQSTSHRSLASVTDATGRHTECKVTDGRLLVRVAINVVGFSEAGERVSHPSGVGPGPTMATSPRTGHAYLLFHRGPTCILLESTTSPHPDPRGLLAVARAIWKTLPASNAPMPTY